MHNMHMADMRCACVSHAQHVHAHVHAPVPVHVQHASDMCMRMSHVHVHVHRCTAGSSCPAYKRQSHTCGPASILAHSSRGVRSDTEQATCDAGHETAA
eukprot:3497482-Prymnesium_polylepis.1